MPATNTDVDRFHTLLEALRASDLEPSAEVNAYFNQLVDVALTCEDLPDRVRHETLAECWNLCADGESALERHWASRVIADPRCIEDFPYRENYRHLAAYEKASLTPHVGEPARWAFVGSGPLPLSVVDLAGALAATTFTCIDADETASALGANVCAALGLLGRTEHLHTGAVDVDYGDYDVVTVAALVGATTSEKHTVLEHIAATCRTDTTIAVRSVPNDGRRLLYPRFASWPEHLHSHGEPAPPHGVVNSVVVIHPPHDRSA